MRTGRVFVSSVAVALALFAGACGDDNPTVATSPSPGAGGGAAVETFSGTLQPSTSSWHAFTAGSVGTVTLTLTNVSGGTVGIGVGTSPTGGCSVQVWNNASTTGTTLTSPINAGGYCAAVYDVGRITGAVSYTLTVDHP